MDTGTIGYLRQITPSHRTDIDPSCPSVQAQAPPRAASWFMSHADSAPRIQGYANILPPAHDLAKLLEGKEKRLLYDYHFFFPYLRLKS
jgi:hypothetical protein